MRCHLQKRSTVRVVDNSALGGQAMADGSKVRIIHVYTKTGFGYVGDKVLLSIKGQLKRALIVGCAQQQRFMQPRFDTNNVVLIEDSGVPSGTRIKTPIPSHLRTKEGDFVKLMSLAKTFV